MINQVVISTPVTQTMVSNFPHAKGTKFPLFKKVEGSFRSGTRSVQDE